MQRWGCLPSQVGGTRRSPRKDPPSTYRMPAPERRTVCNDNLATAFKCISGALKPTRQPAPLRSPSPSFAVRWGSEGLAAAGDVQVLVSGPRPLADPDAAALALRPLPLPANVSQGCLGLPDAEEPCVWLYAPDPARPA